MQTDHTLTILLSRLERIINEFLQLDEVALATLEKFSGKIFVVDIVHTEIQVFILPTAKKIQLATQHESAPDVLIRGTPSALLTAITMPNSTSHLELHGNVGLMQEFWLALKNIEIDWEEYLSQFIGDIAAHKIGNVMRYQYNFIKKALQTTAENTYEYLHYEKNCLAEKLEVEQFTHAVDTLRHDVARLQKRTERLVGNSE